MNKEIEEIKQELKYIHLRIEELQFRFVNLEIQLIGNSKKFEENVDNGE
jgi:hypothetical protein